MTGGAPREGGPLPWLAFGVCCAIWSSTFLFIRIGNDSLAPVWAAALRLMIASVLLTAIALITRQPWPRGAALRAAIAFGFVDFGVSLPLLYWGEKSVPSGVAGVLYATIPLTTAVFAKWFGLEVLRPRTLAAASLGVVGVAILVSSQLAGDVSGWGLAAVSGGALTASLAGVLLKRAPHASPITVNAVAHAAGAVIVIPVSLAMGESQKLPSTTGGWVSVLYLTVVGSIVAFVSFAWLVQRWPSTRISFISVVVPVLALLLGVAARGEVITKASVAGSAVVIGAVVLGLVQPRPARRTAD